MRAGQIAEAVEFPHAACRIAVLPSVIYALPHPPRDVILGLVPRICRRWRFRNTVDAALRRPPVPTRDRQQILGTGPRMTAEGVGASRRPPLSASPTSPPQGGDWPSSPLSPIADVAERAPASPSSSSTGKRRQAARDPRIHAGTVVKRGAEQYRRFSTAATHCGDVQAWILWSSPSLRSGSAIG